MGLVTEGTVIVVSILLAFGLEAAWSAHLERRETSVLLTGIRNDVVENRQVIARSLGEGEQRGLAGSVIKDTPFASHSVALF